MLSLAIAIVTLSAGIHTTSAHSSNDALTNTFWSNAPRGEEDFSLSFKSGGSVTWSVTYDDDLNGTYSVSGSTVSLSFKGGNMTGTGKITGDKMTVTGIVNSQAFPNGVVLTKR